MDRRWQVSPRNADGSRGRVGQHLGPIRLTVTRITLAVALIGSLLYVAFALTVRDASQIPMLSSGAGVLGLVFGALAIGGAVSLYRAASAGQNGRAFGYAVLGGIAAVASAASLAAAVILARLWSG